MATIARRRSAGVTLVELLVVMGLIAILVAISLPAVQAARESARAAQCQTNLRQIALACEQHHAAHQHYAPGQFLGPYGFGPDSRAWSWLARVLPYTEENSLYEMGGIPRKTLRESGVADQLVALFLCPSDTTRGRGPRLDAGNMIEHGFAVGQTNYKGVSGANWGADESQGQPVGTIGTAWPNVGTNGSFDGLSRGDGMFFRTDYLVRRRKEHVTDGLSHTFMIGEDLPAKDVYCSWPYSNNAYSTCAIPPNMNYFPDPTFWPNVQSFRSDHAGGLHFATADGSVHFINEEIDLAIYRAMATIQGGERVDAR